MITSTSIQLHGVEVSVDVSGEGGLPVVLLPGGAATCRGYFPGLVEELASRTTVVVHDRVGTGSSRRPAPGTTVVGWAADVVAVLDALAVEQAVLVGHSLGAAVAAQVVVDSPERVAAALLLDPTPLNDRRACVLASRLVQVLAAPTRLPVVGRAVEIAITRMLRPRGSDVTGREAHQRMSPPGWLVVNARAVRSLPGDSDAFVPRLTGTPVTVVTADRKPTDGLRRAHEELSRDLGGATVLWPGTTHTLHLQRPDLVVDEVLTLLHQSGP